jgi:hypothetical protein
MQFQPVFSETLQSTGEKAGIFDSSNDGKKTRFFSPLYIINYIGEKKIIVFLRLL